MTATTGRRTDEHDQENSMFFIALAMLVTRGETWIEGAGFIEATRGKSPQEAE